MEFSSIYHRPESEFAYLYMDKKLPYSVRTKKGDIKSIQLALWRSFYLYGGVLSDTKEMAKLTSDALFDYWQG